MLSRSSKAAMLVVPMALAAPAMAQSTWIGGVGDWSDGTGWSTGLVPAPATDVLINTGEVTHNGSFDRMGGDTEVSGTGILNVSGHFRNGVNIFGSDVLVAGNGQINQTGDFFMVGHNVPGSFTQNGGVVNSTVKRGWFLSDNPGSDGSYYLNGGLLNVSMTGTNADWNVRFGKSGDNDLFHVNGGTATFTDTESADRRVYIQRNATLLIDSGSATFSQFRFFSVGREAAGDSRVIVNGGSLNILDLKANGGVALGGHMDNSETEFHTGHLEVNGGQVVITGGGGLWVGDGGRGVVEQTGGTILMADLDVILGRSTAAVGSYYAMSGGSLIANNILLAENGAVDAQFIFTGGSITLNGDRTDILSESWFNAVNGTVAIYNASNDTTFITIPEPASIALMGLGAALLVKRRRH